MKIFRIAPFFALLLVFIFAFNPVPVKAASASVNISSATVSVGGTASVKITISSDVEIGVYDLIFSYSGDVLEYSGGATSGGNGTFRLYADGSIGTSDTYTVTFKAKAAGAGRVYLQAPSQANQTGVIFPLAGTDSASILNSYNEGTVTVQAPSNASTNNNLSTLVVSAITSAGETRPVTLSPAFSPSVVTYSATVGEDVTKLSISATPADGKATTKVEWATLDPGDNKTYIKVTSESGAVKTYTINTTVSGETVTSTETTAAATDPNAISVDAEGTTMTVATSLEGVALPSGYTAETYTYKGTEIPVAKSADLGLMLFYLTNADGVGSFYVYDEQGDLFYKYQTITAGGLVYTVMHADDTVTPPLIYERTKVTIDDQEMEGWLNAYEQDFSLVYVMNPSGEKGLYVYDFKEDTIQRFNEKLFAAAVFGENTQSGTNGDGNALVAKLKGVLGSLYGLIAFAVLALICIVLIVICIILAVKNSRLAAYEDDTDLSETIDEPDEFDHDDFLSDEIESNNAVPAPKVEEPTVPVQVQKPEEGEAKIAEDVMTEAELLAFKKQCEEILSAGDSSASGNANGFDTSEKKDLDLLKDDDFEIMDDDDLDNK
ncbi:cadherin-like beta sandwich domain-containing protein [Parasporobacterium paucivorans]|uniref:Cadherin-like beta sandwich domain-containing protein n=1 Tax=Parasporobacterium paucivorans DSM 15970 TaxID=1122934 RepID=A0A1M6HHS9_9FIRM|nr:cadherin-like beta sandwich domain-containing protein [Parasporobacterium paucivorans]SHJ21669.1 Cadherin-like beta sandwich domain-containing protein [Parasporobacterium paucivorans DSM 15970]